MSQFFRANPGATIITVLILLSSFVLGLVSLIMMRAGVSLRPIVFVAGFFLIIIGPQAFFHYGMAFGWIPKKDLTWVAGSNNNSPWQAKEDLLTVNNNRFTQPQIVYGPSVDLSLVSDLRAGMGALFARSEAAEMAVLKTGATVVLAQFSNEQDAAQATEAYATAMVGALPPLADDGTRTVQRGSDVVKVLLTGRTMIAIAARDIATANKLLDESPVITRVSVTASSTPKAEEFWLYRVPVLVAMIVVLLVIAVLWFFKVSAWASEVPAAVGVEPASAGTLRERLLSVNNLDVPFKAEPSPEDSSLIVVTWRYADAKWIDLARAHGIKRTHRILIKLDEANATARPTEQMSYVDWDAGLGGGGIRWITQRGIVFFQYEEQSVFGLQLDSNNKFTSKLSYSYKFNLQEMKAPFIKAVTQSGWKWRPTLVHGPSWLFWLTQ